MKMSREYYIPKGATPINCGSVDAAVYIYECQRPNGPKPAAIAFHGKASKPDWQHWFRNDEECAKKIADYLGNLRHHAERKAERAASRKKPHNYKVGDVLYSSWGYDQTNIDWYQVVEVPGPRTIVTRRIHGRAISDEGPQVKVMPDFGNWHKHEGEAKRHTVTDGSIKVSSCARAWAWDGTPRSETGAHWGH